MKIVYTSIMVLMTATASFGEDYPMTGLSAAATVQDIETELPQAQSMLDEYNKKITEHGMAPVKAEAEDRCFAEFSVVTSTGDYVSYQVQRGLDNPRYFRTYFSQCKFDASSKIETCDTDGTDSYYYYPDPANRLKVITLSKAADAQNYNLNPALAAKDTQTFMSCDKFKDQLLSHIQNGEGKQEKLPPFIGSMMRRILTDQQFAKAVADRLIQ